MREVKAPVHFSTQKAVALPEAAGAGNISIGGQQLPLPLALHKGVAYIARPDGMEIASGVRKTDPVLLTPAHEPLSTLDDLEATGTVGSNPARRPVIAESKGKTLALSSVVTKVPGSGTTKGHHEVELLVADTDTAARAWSARIPLGEMQNALDVEEEDTEVVGLYGDTVALYAQGRLFGVHVDSHQKVWTAPGTYAPGAVLAGGKLVALRDHTDGTRRPVGLNPADGSQKWALDDVSAETLNAASPSTVIVGGYLSSEDSRDGSVLLDAASSKRIETYDGIMAADSCDYDGRSTTICTGADSVVAYNAQTGKERWTLPDKSGNRVAPEVTLVRAGLVYGTTENGPVVLDSTTGADQEDEPGIAPYFSDGYVGIAVTDSDHTVTAYRTEN
ncbi:PQQ-binding-like beta-propeller repeat protein [Streptomyces sp. KN37]|uniref:outer membrane protein assembly factor BamB family protein n=1 Tax=Streptomyces sp. KN37 TaxID=3090667 RepID=UPI002A749239|nr:PQQ-binding-like beta-propeller repeat protein [Streptomyces sp. KN37]WPO76725.1 PQQ-binding-like beta-propeller repeat protein [Streptomyces sp. KN37]